MEIIKRLLRALYETESKDAHAKQIAKHLSRVALYELSSVDALYPDVKQKYLRLEKRMKELGKPIWFVDGFRTAKRQDRLDKTVTRARGLESYHQYGLAFDVAFDIHNWNPPHAWWSILKEEAEKVGLQGIGSWDAGHFQWVHGFTWRDLKPYFNE